jgi:regulator of nucleoside diphosphate kinase
MSSTSTRASRGIFYEPDACIQAFSRTVVAPSGFLHFMKQLWRVASYAEPERGGIPVPNVFLPNVTIPASDFPRLKRLARTAAERGRDADALFLMSELKRAEVVPDCSARLDSIVTMGSWVTFWTNWGFPRETRQLVYPEDYTLDQTQLPVLSPLGAALVGLKVGSEIPFFAAGCTNIVRIDSVSRREPNEVVVLFPRGTVIDDGQFLDDENPGPTAA